MGNRVGKFSQRLLTLLPSPGAIGSCQGALSEVWTIMDASSPDERPETNAEGKVKFPPATFLVGRVGIASLQRRRGLFSVSVSLRGVLLSTTF